MCGDYLRNIKQNPRREIRRRMMATTQPIVSTSEYEENMDDYFPSTSKDDFQHASTYLYAEQQSKSKSTVNKSKPRKNKRSGKDLIN